MQTLTVDIANKKIVVCSKCWRSYCTCRAERFAVDATMIEILKTLNEKGYKTLFHCGGHVRYGEPLFVYVKFSRYVCLPEENKTPTGAGWGYDAYHNQIEYYNKADKLSDEDKIILLSKKHEELLQWVKALPKR